MEKTRQEMVLALTRYEIEWVFENLEHLDEVAEFFANSGFHKYTNESLQKLYELKLAEVE